jgi:transcriptional regulator with XRE-family HTH domain
MSLHAGSARRILARTLRRDDTVRFPAMNEPSLGIWLRRERERRGITLRQIAEQTKVAVPLLEGLEADNLSRWPAGIYRKAFVRSYAVCIGLDPDEVAKRFAREHPPEPETSPLPVATVPATASADAPAAPAAGRDRRPRLASRPRVLGTAADLTVAVVIALGSAAAGSRLLWPVLVIALYYAIGTLLTGTSPMVALLSDSGDDSAPTGPRAAEPAEESEPDASRTHRAGTDRRTPRRVTRAQRASKSTRPRVQ